MRGIIEKRVDGPVIALGPAWCRVAPRDGAEVEVVLEPEGPQRADLAPDIATALDAAPDAAAFFDSLAQFYRNSVATVDRLDETPTGSTPHPDRRDGVHAAARTQGTPLTEHCTFPIVARSTPEPTTPGTRADFDSHRCRMTIALRVRGE